nr:GNAT family N-acetyltransferase [Oryzibacter oryziterrae]
MPELVALYKQLDPAEPDLSMDAYRAAWARIAEQDIRVVCAFVDAVLVSTCTLVVVANLTKGGTPYGFIENVVTHADHRKKGYGRAVLKAAVAMAWEQGCYKVMLLTGSKSPATLAFYSGVGFAQTKTGFQIRHLPPRPNSDD